MVDFHDPVVVLWDSWALVKLAHAVDSLYLWEFFITLNYEWSVIRGRRPYRWTIWVYSFTRVAGLGAVILNMIALNVTASINCQLWLIFQLIFGYIAFVAAALLVVLRIIAIWHRNRVVIVIATVVWLINVAGLIQSIARLRSSRVLGQYCTILNTETSKLNTIVSLVTDLVLLLIMFVGMIRLRRYGGGTFGLGQLMWNQGVIWLVLATIAEVPPTVFVCLNLNVAFNEMFQMPALAIMSICATRMYRDLTTFASEFTDVFQDDLQTGGRPVSGTKGTPQAPIPLSRFEVASRATSEPYPASQMSCPSRGPYPGIDEQLRSQPYGSSLGSDVERRMENRFSWA